MKTKPMLFILTAVSCAVVLYIFRKRNEQKIASKVSDEGYETATDILFPGKANIPGSHYGPVVPQ